MPLAHCRASLGIPNLNANGIQSTPAALKVDRGLDPLIERALVRKCAREGRTARRHQRQREVQIDVVVHRPGLVKLPGAAVQGISPSRTHMLLFPVE